MLASEEPSDPGCGLICPWWLSLQAVVLDDLGANPSCGVKG